MGLRSVGFEDLMECGILPKLPKTATGAFDFPMKLVTLSAVEWVDKY